MGKSDKVSLFCLKKREIKKESKRLVLDRLELNQVNCFSVGCFKCQASLRKLSDLNSEK